MNTKTANASVSVASVSDGDARVRLTRLIDTHLHFADPNADVRGHQVIDSNGSEIGYVRALMVDERAPKVRFLEVAFGGLLGLGEGAFLVPVEAIVRIDGSKVHINQTHERVAGAPRYDPELSDDPTETDYDSFYGYYGYPSYPYL